MPFVKLLTRTPGGVVNAVPQAIGFDRVPVPGEYILLGPKTLMKVSAVVWIPPVGLPAGAIVADVYVRRDTNSVPDEA